MGYRKKLTLLFSDGREGEQYGQNPEETGMGCGLGADVRHESVCKRSGGG